MGDKKAKGAIFYAAIVDSKILIPDGKEKLHKIC